jgi:hypothetical protein
VRSRGLFIKFSFGDYPCIITLPHTLEDFFTGGDTALAQAVDVDALGYAFSDF